MERRTGNERKKFILCFDGTGNKFHGTDADSNILKIYRSLDRSDPSQFHYYQPGIGTYVTTSSLTHTSTYQRLKSWYEKAKDSAVGTSFADHVMGGYRFLMRYYRVGDDIYLFGFSRGAYTARFLAEMLDHVGLLSAGNEEMSRFAWKTFQKWQCRQERTEAERAEKKYLLDFMRAFRETFSRPVRRIRFLGLFDTVNSVPKFETAFLQRSKFPYTARSTAKVIRHAVAIDERRAKFRSDLISEQKHTHKARRQSLRRHRHLQPLDLHQEQDQLESDEKDLDGGKQRGRSPTRVGNSEAGTLQPPFDRPDRYRSTSEISGLRFLTPGTASEEIANHSQRGQSTDHSSLASERALDDHRGEEDDDDQAVQDIQEVWFAGAHGDSGGGWELPPEELPALSHIPLVWMVREAQRAGLSFDEIKLRALNCVPEDSPTQLHPATGRARLTVPEIEISASTPPATPPSESTRFASMHVSHAAAEDEVEGYHEGQEVNPFEDVLHKAAVNGVIHDVLQFGKASGVSALTTLSWLMLEHLPFRRMDLQTDGSWKSITWPLPKGEVRDVPDNVVVHNSVIRRMRAVEKYRPGNLIVGGGGRGTRTAPSEFGMGKWKVLREEGDLIGEVYVRDGPPGPLPGFEERNGIKAKVKSWRTNA